MQVLTTQQVLKWKEWGEAFPFAPGARLTVREAADIIGKSKEQWLAQRDDFFDFRPYSGDMSWMKDPSVSNALLLTAFVLGDSKRKVGTDFRMVHPIATADIAINSGELGNSYYEKIFAAVEAILHDNEEDIISKLKRFKRAQGNISDIGR